MENENIHPKIIMEIKSFGVYCHKQCPFKDKQKCSAFNKTVYMYKCDECLEVIDIGHFN